MDQKLAYLQLHDGVASEEALITLAGHHLRAASQAESLALNHDKFDQTILKQTRQL